MGNFLCQQTQSAGCRNCSGLLVTAWKACSQLTHLEKLNLLFFYLLLSLTDGQDCRVYPGGYPLDKLITTMANSCKKNYSVMEALLSENQHGLSRPNTSKGSCWAPWALGPNLKLNASPHCLCGLGQVVSPFFPCLLSYKLEGSNVFCTGCWEDP